jgi:hypothetical protein
MQKANTVNFTGSLNNRNGLSGSIISQQQAHNQRSRGSINSQSPSRAQGVTMQGVLLKRGKFFKRYQKKYNFILQDHLLKYGKVGKTENGNIIDLREALVTKNDKKGTKVFKIKSPGVKLTLKAAD